VFDLLPLHPENIAERDRMPAVIVASISNFPPAGKKVAAFPDIGDFMVKSFQAVEEILHHFVNPFLPLDLGIIPETENPVGVNERTEFIGILAIDRFEQLGNPGFAHYIESFPMTVWVIE